MNHNFTAIIGARIKEFMAKMKQVNNQIEKTAKDATVNVQADITEYQRKTAQVQAKNLALSRNKVVIQIEARIQDFQKNIARLANNIRAFSELATNTIQGAFVALVPAIAPVVANLGALLASLVPVIATVGASTLSLGFAFASAGVAAGAFAAVAIPNIKNVFEETGKLTKEQEAAKKSFEGFKDVYAEIVKETEKPVLQGFTKGMQAATKMMQMARPLFTASAKAVDELMASLNKSLGTPPVQEFFDYMNKEAAPLFVTMGKSIGNVMQGMGSMFVAFAPLTKSTAQGFLEMTESFAKWADGLDQSKKFAAFMDYVQTNMPKLKSAFADVTVGLVNFFTAFGSMSSDLMTWMQESAASFRAWSETFAQSKGFQDFLAYVQSTAPTVVSLVGELTKFLVNLGIGMAPLGKTILELANSFFSWINGLMESNRWIGTVIAGITTFSGIVMAFLPNIIAMGSLFKGLGGVIMNGLGKAITFVTPLFTNFGGTIAKIATRALPLLGSALGFLITPVGAAGLAIATLGTLAVKTALDLRKPAIESDIFGEKVSANTQKAVGAFMNLSTQATTELQTLAWGMQTLTTENTAAMVQAYEQMGTSILETMNTKHAEQLQSSQDFFNNSKALSATEEAQILQNEMKFQEDQKKAVEDGMKRVNEIVDKAIKEKRELTIAEKHELAVINEEMKTQAVQTMSKSAAEQKAIFEGMKADATKITAEQAAATVKNSKKQKEETVKEAEDQYKKSVAEIIRMRDESKTITAEQADAMIKEAKRTKDNSVKEATDMHKKVVSEAKAQAKEHVNEVNWTEGEVKSKWQVMKDSVATKSKEMYEKAKTGFKDTYESAKTWTGKQATTVSKKYGEMKESVSKWMGKVATTVEEKWNDAQSFLEGINLKDIGMDIVRGLIGGIGDMFDGVKTKVAELASLIPDWMQKKLGIKSPSRVVAKLVGQHIPTGIVKGIDWTMGLVRKAANRLAIASVPDFKKAAEETQKGQIAHFNKMLKTAKKGSEQYKEAMDGLNNVKLETARIQFEKEKEYMDKLVANNENGLQRQIKAYTEYMNKYKAGSEQRIYFEQQVMNKKKELYDKSTALNQEYTDKIAQLSQSAYDKEKAINDNYQSLWESRYKAIESSYGLFDEVADRSIKSSEVMIGNLKDQVDEMKTWAASIQMLAKKGLDEGLVDQLEQAGISSINEVIALNHMTEDELNTFTNLWKQKTQIAKDQATWEMRGLREANKKEIDLLHKETAKQLDAIEKEWAKAIKDINNGTQKEFNAMTSSMPVIGREIINGMIAGLNQTKGSLFKEVDAIAARMKKTLKDALDINSPSRWARDMIGKNFVSGIIVGVNEMRSNLTKSMSKMVDWFTPDFDLNEINSSLQMDELKKQIEQKLNIEIAVKGQGTSAEGGFKQEVHLHSPTELSPSENARQLRRVGQQQAIEWGLA
ncbi:hypothetical protein [Bacillus sp. JJ722]|uniref:hypothetical protein n=1 Tax=Bacillus sp. JJ722 TaxID=3122973 RepID=UPI002FFFD932